jgi:hypothetical protein
MFMRIPDHDARITDLTWMVRERRVVIENMSMAEAAAWASAVDLYNVPHWGEG